MNWKVRREGSPEWVEMTLPQLEQGVADGVWETTDEVQPPGEKEWVALENHPHFAELCEELETQPKPAPSDESHIDMTALIDVTMVLLIFFILTTTVAALQKRMEAPTAEKGKAQVREITKEQISQQMIHVKAFMKGDTPVVLVEDREVDPRRLTAEIQKYASRTKTQLLLEYDDNVTHGLVVDIIDKAKAAGVDKVQSLVP